MKTSLAEIKLLLARLSIALLAYPLAKILFFIFNYSHFQDISILKFPLILIEGLRFDIVALIFINAPFIVFHILPFKFTKSKGYQVLLKSLFLATNSIAVLADLGDTKYYQFTLKRTTADFFKLFNLGNDIITLLPRYLIDFWYVLLLCIVIMIGISYLYNKTNKIVINYPSENRYSRIISWIVFNTLLIGFLIIGGRGGLQLRPIVHINAAEYVEAKNIPLILNTPFSILKSYGLEELEEKHYFRDPELTRYFNPIHSPYPTGISNSSSPIPPNVFIIIMESFSKEYVGAVSKKRTFTPFLDSLLQYSLVFDNAFANGKKSIEGIPAIISGIPSLMNEAYITSIYGYNQIASLPIMLKKKGYSSAFFHGGTNGTMGFDAYSHAAGFDKYYGRFDYNNDKDYDGNWGIWDEPFFQFANKQVSKIQEPFFATIFSLSSHHPYVIPTEYKNVFKNTSSPIESCYRYADNALRKFFVSASKESWFDNTLFIITADHTGVSSDSYYSNTIGGFSIPIAYYKHNSTLRGYNHQITQQIDILPSVLNYIGYNKAFYAFGNSVFDSTRTAYAVNYLNNIYQLEQNDYFLLFDGNQTIGLYNYKTDSLLDNNLAGKDSKIQKPLEDKLKAIIQTYTNDMINNQLSIK